MEVAGWGDSQETFSKGKSLSWYLPFSLSLLLLPPLPPSFLEMQTPCLSIHLASTNTTVMLKIAK